MRQSGRIFSSCAGKEGTSLWYQRNISRGETWGRSTSDSDMWTRNLDRTATPMKSSTLVPYSVPVVQLGSFWIAYAGLIENWQMLVARLAVSVDTAREMCRNKSERKLMVILLQKKKYCRTQWKLLAGSMAEYTGRKTAVLHEITVALLVPQMQIIRYILIHMITDGYGWQERIRFHLVVLSFSDIL